MTGRAPKTPRQQVALMNQTQLFDKSTQKGGEPDNGLPTLIPTLTFLSGEPLGRELPLLQNKIVLGRGEDSDVIVVDPAVSRKHAQLVCRRPARKKLGGTAAGKVVLEDLGSTNGTLVNSRRVTRAVLHPGDKIFLGHTVLKFEYRDLTERQFHEEMYRLATTDELTRLLNKFAITRILFEEIAKTERYLRRLSIVLIDIDDFKSLNDTYGHLAGDRVLQSFADVIRACSRKQDRAGRFGGEEFLVVLPETGLRGASVLAERIRRAVEEEVAAEAKLDRPITASFGIATYRLRTGGIENLLEQADRALYRAKGRGKNRVESWKESMSVESAA